MTARAVDLNKQCKSWLPWGGRGQGKGAADLGREGAGDVVALGRDVAGLKEIETTPRIRVSEVGFP
jgi:hypothetical protein